jgi:hypothetical protein
MTTRTDRTAALPTAISDALDALGLAGALPAIAPLTRTARAELGYHAVQSRTTPADAARGRSVSPSTPRCDRPGRGARLAGCSPSR